MPGLLSDKISLITGGGSGIGRSTALAFAREGAKLVVVDIDTNGGTETVNMIKRSKGEATFIEADVTKTKEVQALIKKTVELYGRLDCAFNNAGIDGVPNASIDELTEEVWDEVINVNLKGVWLCMRYEIPQMLKQGGGVIVNTSSVFGLVGTSGGWGWTPYVASKHGVAGLTKTAALEYVTKGLRINAVCPGPIKTPLIEKVTHGDPNIEKYLAERVPMVRLGLPEEIAEGVVWLCSDRASYVTGHMMSIDGGEIAG